MRLHLRIASAVAVMALTACSSHGVPDAAQNPGAPLTIWVRQPPDSAAAATATRLVRAFRARSGLQVRLVTILDDFESKLQQQAGQRQLPDIVINDTAQLGTMQRQGWLQEISRSVVAGADQLTEASWRAAKAFNGRYYGVPFSAQSFALIVRRDWRLRLGLPEPRSWGDLATMADAFTNRDPDGDGRADTYGLILPGSTKRGYMSWYVTSYLLANGSDLLVRDGSGWRPAINDERSVEAISWLQNLACQRKVVNPDAVTIDTARAHDAFEKGAGGIYLTGPYMLPRFVRTVGSSKIEVFALPNGPSGGPGTLAEGENVYLMAGSGNRAGQRRFAEFATSVEGQTIGMDGDNAGPIVRLPVNKDVHLMSVRTDPRWQTYRDIYQDSGVYTPTVPSWTPFRQGAAEALNAIMADCGSNVRQRLDELAAEFRSLLREQRASAG